MFKDHCNKVLPSPICRIHIQQKKAFSDEDEMEVYGILVWYTYWEYPSMLIKQRSINDILTQKKKKKEKVV